MRLLKNTFTIILMFFFLRQVFDVLFVRRAIKIYLKKLAINLQVKFHDKEIATTLKNQMALYTEAQKGHPILSFDCFSKPSKNTWKKIFICFFFQNQVKILFKKISFVFFIKPVKFLRESYQKYESRPIFLPPGLFFPD